MESAARSIRGIYAPLTKDELAGPGVGIYTGVSYDAYHRWGYASNSALSDLLRSAAHMKAAREKPQEDTTASLIGHAVHCAVLEPDDFDARYALAQRCIATTGKGDQCSNTASRFHADYGWLCGTHAKGKNPELFDTTRALLTPNEWATSLGVRDSVWKNPAAKALLTGDGENELSVVYDYVPHAAYDGEPPRVKTRPDRLSREIAGGAVVDVKTTMDAREDAFMKSIFTYGYYRQGALYLDGAKANQIPVQHFVFIAAEKEAPYACALYRLTEGAVDAGQQFNDRLLAKYAEVERTKEYRAYHTDVRDIAVPDWAWGVIDEQIKRLA